MADKLKVGILIFGVTLAIGLGGFFFWKSRPPIQVRGNLKKSGGPCPGEIVTMKMGDVYMRGLLEKDQSFSATLNWFACNKIENEQLVLYQFSSNSEPVVRRVVAREGDAIRLVKDKDLKGWKLEVNDKEIRATSGGTYSFGVLHGTPNLKTYEDANGGILRSGHVIVFSSFPPGEADSGVFGVVAIEDIVGKVDVIKQ